MARRNRRRRRRGGRRPGNIRRAFNGGFIRGRVHPTSTSAAPWNCYTLTTYWHAAPTPKSQVQCVMLKELRDMIRTELGFKKTNPMLDIDVRLLRLDVWVVPTQTNTLRNCVVLSPSDWTMHKDCGSSAQLGWREAWGTSTQPAHCHYVWPRSISNIVLPSKDDLTLFRFDVRDADTQYLVKFHILWRFSDPDPYPDFIQGKLVSVRSLPPPSHSEDCIAEETSSVGDIASPTAGLVESFQMIH